MKGVIDRWSPEIAEFLPQLLRTRCKLLDLPQAISQAHFPDSLDLKDRARIRLAFDELFLLQLGALARKRRWQISQPANPFKINTALLDKWMQTLPFKFTAAQEKVTTEILEDLKKTVPMSRLLQGEVGSGKTVVAMAALIAAVDNGFQGAFMAPTEILAGQHFASICNLLAMGGQALQGRLSAYYSGVLNKPLTIAS